jgi:hypothetical protein
VSDEVDRPAAVAMFTFKPDKVGFKEIPVSVKPLQIAFTAADKQVEKVRPTFGRASSAATMNPARRQP